MNALDIALFNRLEVDRSAVVTFTNATNLCNYTAHGMSAGDGVAFTNAGGALPTGLTASKVYYAGTILAGSFTMHLTKAAAIAGTGVVAITTDGTGVHTAEALTDVANDLSLFNTRASIFTYEPLPKSIEFPYVIISGPVSDVGNDTKDTTGRRIVRDIRLYTEASGSAVTINNLAESIRSLFHRYALTVTGFKTIYIDVSGPIRADEEDCYGRIVSLDIRMVNT